MFPKTVLLVFFTGIYFIFIPSSFAQENGIENKNEDIDTIVIVKEPVIIVKQIYVEQEKKKDKKHRHWIDLTLSPVMHDNIFNQDLNSIFSYYAVELEYSTDPIIGYAIGISYSYVLKNIFLNVGISLNTYRDRFTDYNSTGFFFPNEYTNQYAYIEPSLKLGYDLQIKRLSVIPYAGYILGTMVSMNGKTIQTNGDAGIIDLKDAQLYTSSAQSAIAGLNLMFRLSDHIEILLDPYYRIDTRPITRSYVPFSLRRQALGAKLGVAYRF